MSRKPRAALGSDLEPGRQDRDNFTHGLVTTAEAGASSPAPSGPSGGDPVQVRTLRPHDTVHGMRHPPEEYERPSREAEYLAGIGTVGIIKS